MVMKLCSVRLLAAGALAFAVFAGQASSALADDKGGIKPPVPVIVVVDIQRALHESNAALGVRAAREKYAQTYQAEVTKDEDGLRKIDEELAKQRTILSPEAFADKRRAFEQQIGEFQRKLASRRRALDRSYAEAMDAVQQRLLKITSDIATESGANMVVSNSQVVLFDPKFDITAMATARLNKDLPTVAFAAPKEDDSTSPTGDKKAAGKK